MELDELKYQLNQKLATDHASRTDADIAALLKKKTSSVINKLKRSLIIEMILCILFSAAMLYVVVVSSYWSIRLYFGVFTVLMFGFTFILYYLYQRTQKLTDSQQPVKAKFTGRGCITGRICETLFPVYHGHAAGLFRILTYSLQYGTHIHSGGG